MIRVGGSTVAPTLSRLTHLPYHRYQSAGLATVASHAHLCVTFWGLDLTSAARLRDCIMHPMSVMGKQNEIRRVNHGVKFKLKAANFLFKANFIFLSSDKYFYHNT